MKNGPVSGGVNLEVNEKKEKILIYR